jgi:O-antigen/teichoic acid export membrane protein
MFQKILKITKDVTVMGTLIVTLGMFIGSGFAYLLQFALGRLLSVPEYGTFNALLSLFNIVGVPIAVIGTSLVKLASELKATNRFDKLTHIFWKFTSFSLVVGLTVFGLTVLASGFLSDYLNIEDTRLFYSLGLLLAFSFFTTIPVSFLNGLLRFKAFAFTTVSGAFLRLVIPVIFVLIGYRVGGVIFGITIATFLTYIIGTILLKKNFSEYKADDLSLYYRRIKAIGFSVLFVNLGLMLMNNIDLILVKRYFTEDIAGYYAGAVTVSKILLFGAGTVVVVMFPQISELYTRGLDYSKRLKTFLMLQVFLVVSGIIFFVLYAEQLTRLMFGEKFLPSVEYIPLFTVFIGLYVMINFMIMFFLAIGKTKVFLLQLPAVVIQFVLISLFHESLYDVIKINIVAAAFSLLMIMVYYYKNIGFGSLLPSKVGKTL